MPLNWNEIKDRALQFSKEWEGESRERAEKDSFYNDFFKVFGIAAKRKELNFFLICTGRIWGKWNNLASLRLAERINFFSFEHLISHKVMNLNYLSLLISIVTSFNLFAQSTHQLQQIHQTQNFYLNNSSRAILGTGDNRTYLAVDLPSKTVEWYFSFSATQSESTESLNLYSQLINVLDPSGLTSSVLESIAVPDGNIQCNIYLANEANAMDFDQHLKFNYIPAGSRMNYTDGTVRINTFTGGRYYLCFENPHTWKGLNIAVEVVALVDTATEKLSMPTENVKPSPEEVLVDLAGDVLSSFKESKRKKTERKQLLEESSNYKSTGHVLYEAGDFEKSLIYSQKALDIEKHPSTYFNIGLAYWCKNDEKNCTSYYLEGLNLIYQLEEKEEAIEVLKSGIADLKKGKDELGFYEKAPIALKLLELKLSEVENLEKWKDRY